MRDLSSFSLRPAALADRGRVRPHVRSFRNVNYRSPQNTVYFYLYLYV